MDSRLEALAKASKDMLVDVLGMVRRPGSARMCLSLQARLYHAAGKRSSIAQLQLIPGG